MKSTSKNSDPLWISCSMIGLLLKTLSPTSSHLDLNQDNLVLFLIIQ